MNAPPPLTSGTAELSPTVRLHYMLAGTGGVPVILIHGYPQTWWQWRHVIAPLVEAGFYVIAADDRGAGKSSKPLGGYDKQTMAEDIHTLVLERPGVREALTVAGHDIGSMVAYAFARGFPEDVAREAPLPGTDAFRQLLSKTQLANDPLWHFGFYNAPDNLAETLAAGREQVYLSAFYDQLAFNTEAITPADRERYGEALASVGALRAGSELYCAFDRDAETNRATLHAQGRLEMPVLVLAGEHSKLAPIIKPMMAEVAEQVTVSTIPAAGHWTAEENPPAVAEALISFLRTDSS